MTEPQNTEPQNTEPPSYNPPPQNNYVPPAGQQFQPPPAFQQSQSQQQPYQPQPLSPQDERTWALLAHILTIVAGFIAPLVVLLVQGEKSPMVRAHAVESLNFQITVTIGYIASSILMVVFIGFLTFFAVWAAALVFAILATIAASKGLPYKYPLTLRLVK
ncbi:DUF4870 domain-containing protein [Kribbella antibiotica]|uniref:DUF4870 domain-containing protein n=1 Tax=Kribbella antibiotica TaxID=190195 RepID=A0A4V2YPJ0_9ACTN|nr:DUF4870 domain-containing protein [Kribbella antibiotica]TDD58117.1 DUF4870 domain-containing protein [Kribbella antibiotica]